MTTTTEELGAGVSSARIMTPERRTFEETPGAGLSPSAGSQGRYAAIGLKNAFLTPARRRSARPNIRCISFMAITSYSM